MKKNFIVKSAVKLTTKWNLYSKTNLKRSAQFSDRQSCKLLLKRSQEKIYSRLDGLDCRNFWTFIRWIAMAPCLSIVSPWRFIPFFRDLGWTNATYPVVYTFMSWLTKDQMKTFVKNWWFERPHCYYDGPNGLAHYPTQLCWVLKQKSQNFGGNRKILYAKEFKNKNRVTLSIS